MSNQESPQLSPFEFGADLVLTMRSALNDAAGSIEEKNRIPATIEDGRADASHRVRGRDQRRAPDRSRGGRGGRSGRLGASVTGIGTGKGSAGSIILRRRPSAQRRRSRGMGVRGETAVREPCAELFSLLAYFAACRLNRNLIGTCLLSRHEHRKVSERKASET